MRPLARRYGRFIFGGGRAPAAGGQRVYKGWTVRALSRSPGVGGLGEFELRDAQGRLWGTATSWRDALDLVDERQAEREI